MARHKIDFSKKPINVLSLGAGKQSTMLLYNMITDPEFPKPDFAVFADTGVEPKYVYQHLSALKLSVWERFNFKINTVQAGNIEKMVLAHVAGRSSWAPDPPFYLSKGGLIRRQCTLHLKIRPIRKFYRSINNFAPINNFIGISSDEMTRQKKSDLKYVTNHYPFIEKKISLSSIKEKYKLIGELEPGKSSCIICPFHSNSYWYKLSKVEPESFKMACEFDRKIRNYPQFSSKCFLHKSLKPLDTIDFSGKDSLFPELLDECEGLCGL